MPAWGSIRRGGRTRWASLAVAVAVAAGCASVSAPRAQSDIPINGSRVHPESITSDAAGNIYVSSVGGTIYRARAGGATAEPWIAPTPENGLTSLFGVLADDPRGLLWACNNPPFGGPPQPGAKSSLKAFELATGALKASYDLPGEGPFACNDIAVGRLGATFATDTAGGRIFVLAPDGEALTLFAADPALVGIDGIAFSQDGTMYINNVRQNSMQRVNRNGNDFAGLTTLTLSQPISGPDGLRPVSGNRFLQAEGSGNRVTYVDSSGDNATITPVRTGLESSPGVTRVGSTGYATEGKIGYLFDPALRDKNPDPFIIRAFPLP
jgi:sugar lactone lactonase YvrE